MGRVNSTVAYGFGQMGSGHITTTNALYPPTGRKVVAITMLEPISFHATNGLTVDTDYIANGAAANDDGVAFFGQGTQLATNGHDNASTKAAVSEAVADDVVFPTGLTIYGRWSTVRLAAAKVHGIIVYYGE